MMTKDQFAHSLIEEYALHNNIHIQEVSPSHIYKSSKLALAMEHLGLLPLVQDRRYAASRDGILLMTMHGGKTSCLTVREILNMLPEA